MTTWALVPVKAFERAKSRLSSVLTAEERARFARELFDHVVEALQSAAGVDHVAVVSDSVSVRAYAERLQLFALRDDPQSAGLSDVVNSAIATLEQEGATSVLVVMSDLPTLSVDNVRTVLQQLESADVVLVPDELEQGTNLIACRPPSCVPSCLGHEDSLLRHRTAAETRGLKVHVQRIGGIAFDVDDPRDLARYQQK